MASPTKDDKELRELLITIRRGMKMILAALDKFLGIDPAA